MVKKKEELENQVSDSSIDPPNKHRPLIKSANILGASLRKNPLTEVLLDNC